MGSQLANLKLLESSRDLEDRIASAPQNTNTGQGCRRAAVGIGAAPLYLQHQAPATQCYFATAAPRIQRCANRPLSGQVATRRLAATPIPQLRALNTTPPVRLFPSCDFPWFRRYVCKQPDGAYFSSRSVYHRRGPFMGTPERRTLRALPKRANGR